ncbi:minor tail protein [Mycobacterium phage Baudelaire]|nr:minor tail protein [Mycobacterium phage Baudelaire]
MTMPSGVAGLDPGGWLAGWVDGKGDAPDLSGLAGRTQTAITDFYRNQVQGDTSWQNASLTFFTNILHGFQDLGTLVSLITKAVTGSPGGLTDLTAFVTQRWNDLADAFEKAVDSFLGLKWLRDALTGLTGATDAQVTNWVQQLLTAASNLDAAKVIGLLAAAVIPGLDASKITSGQFVVSMISGLQSWFDGIAGKAGAVVGDVVTRLQNLATNGLFDATKLFGTLLASFIPGLDASKITSGTIAEVITGINTVRDAFVNGLGLAGNGFSNTDAKNQAIQVAQTAAQAAAATSAIQAQYQRQQATVPSGLLNYITTFGGADGAALPAEFTGSDLEIRTGNGYCGIDASRGDGTYYATNNKVATTDDVQVTVTLGDAGGLNSIATYVLFSSDTGYTTGAYFGINGQQAVVGKYSRSGGTFTFNSPFISWYGPFGQGLSATVYRKTNNWVLDVGGDVKATATDSSVTTGASNRTGGAIVMQRKTASGGWLDGNHLYDSFRLASLFFGDFYAKTTFYSGGKMTRNGGSTINGPSHSYSLPQGSSTTFSGVLPSGFYGVQNFASDDVTVNVSAGSITINNPGLYYVHYDLPWTTVATGNGSVSVNGVATTDVVVNTTNHIPLVSQETQTIPAGNDGSGGGTISLYWDKPEFLRLSAGDVVQIGYTLPLKNVGLGSKSGSANMAYAAGSGFFGIYKMG